MRMLNREMSRDEVLAVLGPRIVEHDPKHRSLIDKHGNIVILSPNSSGHPIIGVEYWGTIDTPAMIDAAAVLWFEWVGDVP